MIYLPISENVLYVKNIFSLLKRVVLHAKSILSIMKRVLLQVKSGFSIMRVSFLREKQAGRREYKDFLRMRHEMPIFVAYFATF